MWHDEYKKRPERPRSIRHPDGFIIGPRADLRGKNLSGMDLSFVDLREADIREDIFNDSDLTGADFRDAIGDEASFKRAILTDAHLYGAVLRKANFEGAIIKGAFFNSSDLGGCNLSGVVTENDDYSLNELTYFIDATLAGASLVSAKIKTVTFESSDLSSANLENAELDDIEFSYCGMQNVNLKNAKISYCSLVYARLQGGDFSGAHIYASDLSDAIFLDSNNHGGPNLKDTIFNFCYFTDFTYMEIVEELGGTITNCVDYDKFEVAEVIVATFAEGMGLDPAELGLIDLAYLGDRGEPLPYISWPYDKSIKDAMLVNSILESLELAACELAQVKKRGTVAETVTRAMYTAPAVSDTILGMAYEALEICIKIIDSKD